MSAKSSGSMCEGQLPVTSHNATIASPYSFSLPGPQVVTLCFVPPFLCAGDTVARSLRVGVGAQPLRAGSEGGSHFQPQGGRLILDGTFSLFLLL